MKRWQVFANGIFRENPIFRLVLGMCPTLAVSTSVANGVGMGVAATFVLVCSNAAISLVRGVVPSKVRIPCYIVIIATFVTVVDLLMNAFAHEVIREIRIEPLRDRIDELVDKRLRGELARCHSCGQNESF